jgi:hypothetical protein
VTRWSTTSTGKADLLHLSQPRGGGSLFGAAVWPKVRTTLTDLLVVGADADDVIRQIQTAIVYAGLNSKKGQGGMTLLSVKIEMTAVAELTTGLKPKFKVPWVGWEIGAEVSNTDVETHTIEVTLHTPWAPLPPAGDSGLAKGIALPDITIALPAVIESMRELLAQAKVGPARLDLSSANISFKFDVSKEGKLELAVPYTDRKRQSTVETTFAFSASEPDPK